MKILHLLSTLDIHGGTPKKLLDLIGASQHQHAIYYWTKGCVPELHDRFEEIFRKAGAALFDGTRTAALFMHLARVIRIVDQNGIDVIHSYSDFGDVVAGVVRYSRPALRHFVSLVNANPASGTVRRILLSAVYKRATQVVYVSDYVRRQKQSHFPVLQRQRGIVVHNGTHRRAPDGTFDGRLTKVALLTIGGINAHKNLPVLVETMDILVNRRGEKNLFLYVVGDGPDRRKLEMAIAQRQIGVHAAVLGYQTDIGELLEQADIYLHPATNEGFGIALAEAMRAAKPIVAARAGAIPELVEDRKSGLLVEPCNGHQWADAVLEIVEHPDLRATLARQAKARADALFNAERFARVHDDLYQAGPVLCTS